VLKPPEDFAIRRGAKDGLQNRCRGCYQLWYAANAERARVAINQRRAVRRAEALQKLALYLDAHPCVDCGESDIRTLDFDHRVGEQKRWTVSQMLSGGWNWATVMTEIAKCDVRCANCHRRVTMERADYWREAAYRERAAVRRAVAVGRLRRLFPQASM
jgi:hypothetical protein